MLMNAQVYSYMLKLMSMSFSKVTLDILDVQQCSADCRIRVSKCCIHFYHPWYL